MRLTDKSQAVEGTIDIQRLNSPVETSLKPVSEKLQTTLPSYKKTNLADVDQLQTSPASSDVDHYDLEQQQEQHEQGQVIAGQEGEGEERESPSSSTSFAFLAPTDSEIDFDAVVSAENQRLASESWETLSDELLQSPLQQKREEETVEGGIDCRIAQSENATGTPTLTSSSFDSSKVEVSKGEQLGGPGMGWKPPTFNPFSLLRKTGQKAGVTQNNNSSEETVHFGLTPQNPTTAPNAVQASLVTSGNPPVGNVVSRQGHPKVGGENANEAESHIQQPKLPVRNDLTANDDTTVPRQESESKHNDGLPENAALQVALGTAAVESGNTGTEVVKRLSKKRIGENETDSSRGSQRRSKRRLRSSRRRKSEGEIQRTQASPEETSTWKSFMDGMRDDVGSTVSTIHGKPAVRANTKEPAAGEFVFPKTDAAQDQGTKDPIEGQLAAVTRAPLVNKPQVPAPVQLSVQQSLESDLKRTENKRSVPVESKNAPPVQTMQPMQQMQPVQPVQPIQPVQPAQRSTISDKIPSKRHLLAGAAVSAAAAVATAAAVSKVRHKTHKSEEDLQSGFREAKTYESIHPAPQDKVDEGQLRRTLSDESDYRSVKDGADAKSRHRSPLKSILRSSSVCDSGSMAKSSKSGESKVRFAKLDSVFEFWTEDEEEGGTVWDLEDDDVFGIPDRMHVVVKLAGRALKRPKAFWRGAKNLVKFLQAVDSVGANLYKGEAVRAAIFRYERVWLPLYCSYLVESKKLGGELNAKMKRRVHRLIRSAKKIANIDSEGSLFRNTPPVPPIDVAWIWFLHRCSPKMYKADCERVYGVVLHTQRKNAFKYETSGSPTRSAEAKELWKTFVQAFGTNHSTYYEHITRHKFLPRYLWSYKVYDEEADRTADPSLVPRGWLPRSSYDLSLAARRQRDLLCICTGEDFTELCCSIEALTLYRYMTYLHLAGKHKNFLAMPDIEPLLYAHMAATRTFFEDSKRIAGRLIDPDAISTRKILESDEGAARVESSNHTWMSFIEDEDLDYCLSDVYQCFRSPSRTRAGYLDMCIQEEDISVTRRRTRRSTSMHSRSRRSRS